MDTDLACCKSHLKHILCRCAFYEDQKKASVTFELYPLYTPILIRVKPFCLFNLLNWILIHSHQVDPCRWLSRQDTVSSAGPQAQSHNTQVLRVPPVHQPVSLTFKHTLLNGFGVTSPPSHLLTGRHAVLAPASFSPDGSPPMTAWLPWILACSATNAFECFITMVKGISCTTSRRMCLWTLEFSTEPHSVHLLTR